MNVLGILFALLSAISYATNNVINKKIVEKLNEYEALVFSSLFLIFFSGIFNMLWGEFTFSLTSYNLTFLFFGSFIGFIGLLYLFKSFSYLPVGIILTIANTFPLFTLLLTTLYHNLSFNFLYFIPLILIFSGIYYLHKTSKKITKKYLYFPLITAFSWGFYSFVSFSLLKESISPYTLTFYLETFIFLYALLFSLFKKNYHLLL
jgi:drug/metabolite transporter (DMT)-like permease